MKIRDIITEADVSDLGKMDPKMADILSQVRDQDIEDKAKADAERAAKGKAKLDKIMALAKKHGYDLDPASSGYFMTGVNDGKRGYRDRSAGDAYGPHVGAYDRGVDIGMKIADQGLDESATAGATSAGNIASVEAPHLSPGSARGKKSYLGKPGSHGGTKAPPQPKVKQPKKRDGTAVNALDMGTSLFGKGAVKR